MFQKSGGSLFNRPCLPYDYREPFEDKMIPLLWLEKPDFPTLSYIYIRRVDEAFVHLISSRHIAIIIIESFGYSVDFHFEKLTPC